MTKKSSQRNGKGGGFSKLIINLALIAVSVSVMVMILAIAIVKGYQHEVRDKLVGFNAPIQITHLDLNNSFESLPIEQDSVMEVLVAKKEGITFIQPYATKAGIIKTTDSFEGIVLKGVSKKYNWQFMSKYLIEGKLPVFSDSVSSKDILISSLTANRLKLKLHDPVFIYFIEDPPRVRKFTISGIFDTGMGELDELYSFVDIRQVQKLNNWPNQFVSGYEIGVQDIGSTKSLTLELASLVPFQMGLSNIFDRYPALFEWLGLLDLNVVIILALMLAVASINMITALLILILERTQMIGLLKAMGSENNTISNVFLWMAMNIILKGLLIGNLFGIGIAYCQKQFGWIKLDQKSYYLNQVPIELNLMDIVWVNLLGIIICLLLLILPAKWVSKIQPIKSIRFN